MGILKTLGNCINFVADSPIPEIIGLVGGLLGIASVAVAYEADSRPAEADSVTFEDDLPETNPCTPILHLLPTDDFSITRAVKEYKQLDTEGKLIFKLTMGSLACGFVAGTLNLIRYCTLHSEIFDLKMKNAKARCNLAMMSVSCDDVVAWYDTDPSRLADAGDTKNYHNIKIIKNDLEGILEILK